MIEHKEAEVHYLSFQYGRALAMAWIDTATTENEELEPIWRERAKDVLGEDLEKREEWIEELKELVIKEKDLKVPESEQFFLKFLRSGLMSPIAGLGVMQNYFSLKKNYARYFQVNLSGCVCFSVHYFFPPGCHGPGQDGQHCVCSENSLHAALQVK